MQGPLRDLRVLEFAGLGPAPHAAMMLSDLGADVVRVERPDGDDLHEVVTASMLRGRRRTVLDLKLAADLAVAEDLVARADVLLEGFRPGVMERLGLGPDHALERNPRLIYGRVTGWGRSGPRAGMAGHDLNYLATSGVLSTLGSPDEPPRPPANLVADYGGGSMLLVVGVLAALQERERSGAGQVVDAAMVDGVGLLAHQLWCMRSGEAWSDDRGTNLLDGGAPFYRCYRCADGRDVAVASIEPQFYEQLLDGLDLSAADLPTQWDRARWPELQARLAARFLERSRAAWEDVFAGTDACVTPVLGWQEAREDAHARGREAFIELNGTPQPAPAPRFTRTPTGRPTAPSSHHEPPSSLLDRWGPDDA